MPESTILLTPLHYLYLLGVIVILVTMIARKDTPIVCIIFLFIFGLVGLGSIAGGIQVIFQSIVYAAKEFIEIMATIALVTAFSKCLIELGSDSLLMAPMKKIMKTPAITWWILGITMMLFSLFLWPSPSVALVGAIILPFAIKTGLNPLAAAMAINLFGHGIALSYDFIIQGAPSISAGAAGITTSQILTEGRPLFLVMGITTVSSAFFLNRNSLSVSFTEEREALFVTRKAKASSPSSKSSFFCPSVMMAVLTPVAFISVLFFMARFHLSGGAATSMVSGTAVLLMCIGAILGFGKQSLGKVTSYITDGFLFSIRIFSSVIVIGAFFFLGGSGINTIMGIHLTDGIMNDWATWLSYHIPINPYMAALLEMIVGGLTGLDGSGFSGLPLAGSLANTLGSAVGISVPLLAALGQITAIFVGGGTIVPWGLIPVAAICNVSPFELAAKNLIPVALGFAATFITACILL